jgi:hypothetical protein
MIKEKSLEIKLRRWATQKNLILQRARRHNKKDRLFGTYHLLDNTDMKIIIGDKGGYGKTLNEIEDFLLQY